MRLIKKLQTNEENQKNRKSQSELRKIQRKMFVANANSSPTAHYYGQLVGVCVVYWPNGFGTTTAVQQCNIQSRVYNGLCDRLLSHLFSISRQPQTLYCFHKLNHFWCTAQSWYVTAYSEAARNAWSMALLCVGAALTLIDLHWEVRTFALFRWRHTNGTLPRHIFEFQSANWIEWVRPQLVRNETMAEWVSTTRTIC